MLTLEGWDLLTIADVKLVNAAMAARHNELITSFDYRGDPLKMSGSFGTWSIRPGGSITMLEVAIPIDQGQIEGIPNRRAPLKISGVTLLARLALSLLPIKDSPDTRELRFDFDESAKASDGVIGLDIEDPNQSLNMTERQLLKKAAALCLAAHASNVSYVIASVKTRGSTDGAAFDLPHHDWANVVTADGRHYLAIAGAFSDKVKPLRNIDPGLIATEGGAYIALSPNLFARRFLLPVMETDFRPKAQFSAGGNAVRNRHPIRLGVQKHGIWSVEPIIRSLTVGSDRTGLAIRADTTAELPVGALLSSHYAAQMAFHFDPKARTMTFRPDPKPKESHNVSMGIVSEILLGWLVRLIVMLNSDAITALTKGIAHRMQSITTSTVGPTGWSGVRDFELGHAVMNGAIVMTDTRPV